MTHGRIFTSPIQRHSTLSLLTDHQFLISSLRSQFCSLSQALFVPHSEKQVSTVSGHRFARFNTMGFIYSQLFAYLPYPTGYHAGQTIVITGSNTGLGKEAARHFARLGASKLVCRDCPGCPLPLIRLPCLESSNNPVLSPRHTVLGILLEEP